MIFFKVTLGKDCEFLWYSDYFTFALCFFVIMITLPLQPILLCIPVNIPITKAIRSGSPCLSLVIYYYYFSGKTEMLLTVSPIHTFVNIPALLLKNTLRFLIRDGIFTKVWIRDISYMIFWCSLKKYLKYSVPD